MSDPVRVLIVDDSAVARQGLTEVLEGGGITVIGSAADPFQAAARLRDEVPDVILLDIEMPRMDGITFLKRLMRQHPIPTVICSSIAQTGSATALAALEAGAVDVIVKPTITTRSFFAESSAHICQVVRGAAQARLGPPRPRPLADTIRERRSTKPAPMLRTTEKVVVVGASTGGTEAIREFLESFGPDAPAIAIVQHMPPGFTANFARRLDQICRIHVKEAAHGDALLPGQALIAPGDRHMSVQRSGARYFVEISDTAPVNRHRPSVDVLFHSAATVLGANAVGVIMTGMGDDGARGLRAMRDAGAHTLAQDEASCIVYGMPREAVRLEAAVEVLDLRALAPEVRRSCGHAA